MNPTSSTPTNEAVEEQWENYMKDKGLNKETTSGEALVLARQCFLDGQVIVISSMQEIYYNDPCLFEEFFEENGEDEDS